MEKCPICDSDRPPSNTSCNCGFDFEKKEIVDINMKPKINVDKIRSYRWKIKSNKFKHWSEEVLLKTRITKIQGERYGLAKGVRAGGHTWSKLKTAELLDEAKNTTTQDIKLAEYFDLYPELSKFKKKSEALARRK